ncbi:MAG: RimK family alpha-L-glutamate ligase [Geminicoccaceae bacterium]
MGPPEVLILGGRPEGWHGAKLREAFTRLGARVARRDFRTLGLALGEGGTGIAGLPGLPTVALVRSIPAGSFEEVTLRLGLLHALQALGVPVVNGPRAIERCVDKSMTSFLLHRAGLPTPPTWVTQSAEEARALCGREAAAGHRTVLKPLFGAQGRGLRLLNGSAELPPPEEVGGIYYLQRFIGPAEGSWRDFRVFVVGGSAIAAMQRHGASWITNIGQGGRAELAAIDGRLAALAVAAAQSVEAAHAGVDLIPAAGGGYWILEVNSMPAWQGLQSVSEVDIALHLARDVLAQVRPGRPVAA